MNDTELKDMARNLSAIATRKEAAFDLSSVQQAVGNPYVQNALLGAGAGGLIGALQGKKKRRAMLDYAVMGGLGGLGATAAKEMLLKPATPPPSVAAAGYDNNTGSTVGGLAAAGAGAYGGRQLANAVDARGKLDRLLATDKTMAKQLGGTLEHLRDTGGTSQIADRMSSRLRSAPALNYSHMTRAQWLNHLLRGPEHHARDVGLHLSDANIYTPAQAANAAHTASRTARGSFFGGMFGRNSDRAANTLAAVAAETGGPAAKGLTGAKLQAALRKLPRVGGKWLGLGLPIIGALAGPAALNSFSGGAASE
jgi:hypothetical protein